MRWGAVLRTLRGLPRPRRRRVRTHLRSPHIEGGAPRKASRKGRYRPVEVSYRPFCDSRACGGVVFISVVSCTRQPVLREHAGARPGAACSDSRSLWRAQTHSVCSAAPSRTLGRSGTSWPAPQTLTVSWRELCVDDGGRCLATGACGCVGRTDDLAGRDWTRVPSAAVSRGRQGGGDLHHGETSLATSVTASTASDRKLRRLESVSRSSSRPSLRGCSPSSVASWPSWPSWPASSVPSPP